MPYAYFFKHDFCNNKKKSVEHNPKNLFYTNFYRRSLTNPYQVMSDGKQKDYREPGKGERERGWSFLIPSHITQTISASCQS